MHTSWVHGHVPPDDLNTIELVAWAVDDEDLMVTMQEKVRQARLDAPGMVFEWYGPFYVYFLLDDGNFTTLLNTTLEGKQVAKMIWENCRLAIPATATNFNPGEQLYAITQVKSQGSPRKTWSNGK